MATPPDQQGPEQFNPTEGIESNAEIISGQEVIEKSIEDVQEVRDKIEEELGLVKNSPELHEASNDALVYLAKSTLDVENLPESAKVDAVEDVLVESAMEVDVGGQVSGATPVAELDGEDFDRMFRDIEAQFATDHAVLPSGHEAAPVVGRILDETEGIRDHTGEDVEIIPAQSEQDKLIDEMLTVRNSEQSEVGPEEAEQVNEVYNGLIDDMLLKHVGEIDSWAWSDGTAGHGLILETKSETGQSVLHIEVIKATEGDGVVNEANMGMAQAFQEAMGRDKPMHSSDIQLKERISFQVGGEEGEAWTYFQYEDGSVRRINSPEEVMKGGIEDGAVERLRMMRALYDVQQELGTNDYQVSMKEMEEVRKLLNTPALHATRDSYTNLIPPTEIR